jgi:DNA invertase Pin-like site-specific DNA recombinase
LLTDTREVATVATSKDTFALARVSTGSQDETTQLAAHAEYAAANGLDIKKTVRLRGYSASKGEQQPVIRTAIEGIERGLWRLILVTDSSRLDRDEDLDAQAAILLAVRQAGGDVISIAEPQFGKTDFAGRLVTLVAQHANAEKSRVVKESTWRGVRAIIDNGAWHGPLPRYWTASGERYHKVATCVNPDAVRALYEAVRDGRSLSSLARDHDMYPQNIRKLVQTRANMTGVFDCRYTYRGQLFTWQHAVAGDPPVSVELWHAANLAMGERGASMNNLAGRPVGLATSWISGLLPCPGCGGNLYVSRKSVLNCGGKGKDRRSCGVSGIGLAEVTAQVEAVIERDDVPVYRYQRVAGNRGALAELNNRLDGVRQVLAVTDNEERFAAAVAERAELRAAIEAFELVPDDYQMSPTGETLAELWRGGDKREVFKVIQRHVAFYFLPAPAPRDQVWTRDLDDDGQPSFPGESYPGGTLIELGPDVCVRFPASLAA